MVRVLLNDNLHEIAATIENVLDQGPVAQILSPLFLICADFYILSPLQL